MKEFNLRERAEIVSIAMECSESFTAQPLIDYFTKAFQVNDFKIIPKRECHSEYSHDGKHKPSKGDPDGLEIFCGLCGKDL